MHVNGTLVEPRDFTAYDGSDAAELTQEKGRDEILAEAVRNASSDQVTAADGAAALPAWSSLLLPVAPRRRSAAMTPKTATPALTLPLRRARRFTPLPVVS